MYYAVVSPPRCQNCGSPLAGPFCHECGQKHIEGERPLLRVLGEWLSETFEADGRLARTLVPFFFRPGLLVRDYLAGRRARYMPPLRLYIFAVLIAFFTLGLLVNPDSWGAGNEPTNLEFDVADEPDANDDSLLSSLKKGLHDRGERLSRMPARDAVRTVFAAFVDSAPTVLTLLVPVFALLLKLLYWRRYFVDHLLFSLVLHALALLLATLAGLFGLLSDSGWPALLAVVAVAVHVVVGMHRIYEGPRWATGLRAAVVFAVYPLGLAAATVLSLLLAIWKS